MKKGQRVKLSERGLRYHLSQPRHSHRGKIIEWRNREGTVISATLRGVVVHWDDNKTRSDIVSDIFLQLISKEADE